MKKLIFTSTLTILFAGMLFSQSIKKGNLLGIHVLDEATMNPGVTSEQVEHFFFNTYIPAFQKEFKKIKVVPMKGIRGEHANKLGMIMVLKSENDRAIYWNEDGSFNQSAQALLENLQPVFEEMSKLGTSVDLYTDWLVK
jgi:hypothetical protein